MRHDPIIDPTEEDLIWAAGFLEGEGYFAACYSTPKVTAAQVNPEPLAKLLMLFGGSVCLYKRSKRKQIQPIWVWGAYGIRAKLVSVALYPYLSEYRKLQVRQALTGLRNPPNFR